MKIAFVDIDGCLVQDGKLNPRLVERLKGYDQVILFTQRGKHIQQRSLSNEICGRLIEAEEKLRNLNDEDFNRLMSDVKTSIESLILTTYDAVIALKEKGIGEVKVSTSMDPYYSESIDLSYKGKVLDYYPQQLAEFERALKKHYITEGLEGSNISDDLQESIKKEYVMVSGKKDYHLDTIDKCYPQGKVEQFRQLSAYLRDQNAEVSIDYFDDHKDNPKEILSSEEISVKPRCLLVTGASIVEYTDAYEQNSIEYKELVDKLQNYINTRAAEQQNTGKGHNSHRAGFFKRGAANADVKMTAAEKVLDKYLNGRDVSFTRTDYKALQDARLGQIIKEFKINLGPQHHNTGPR